MGIGEGADALAGVVGVAVLVGGVTSAGTAARVSSGSELAFMHPPSTGRTTLPINRMFAFITLTLISANV